MSGTPRPEIIREPFGSRSAGKVTGTCVTRTLRPLCAATVQNGVPLRLFTASIVSAGSSRAAAYPAPAPKRTPTAAPASEATSQRRRSIRPSPSAAPPASRPQSSPAATPFFSPARNGFLSRVASAKSG